MMSQLQKVADGYLTSVEPLERFEKLLNVLGSTNDIDKQTAKKIAADQHARDIFIEELVACMPTDALKKGAIEKHQGTINEARADLSNIAGIFAEATTLTRGSDAFSEYKKSVKSTEDTYRHLSFLSMLKTEPSFTKMDDADSKKHEAIMNHLAQINQCFSEDDRALNLKEIERQTKGMDNKSVTSICSKL